MSHTPLYLNLALNNHFENLGEGMQQVLEEHLSLVRLSENDVLFQQGGPGDCLYVLIKGRIGVRMRDAKGNEFEIGEEFEPGTTIGEMALVTGQNRAVTVYALSDSKLVRLSKNGFDQLAEKHSRVLADIVEIMAPRWCTSSEQMGHIGI